MSCSGVVFGMLALACVVSAALGAEPASGPLRLHPRNPRYFADGTGRAVLLAGSHTWNNLLDMGATDPPPKFDFDAYLDWMAKLNHNFIRLWAWELVSWDTRGESAQWSAPKRCFASPQPWLRTGPEKALDGKPKFDLARFSPDYFERLHTRVEAAGKRGIYVSIMLFEGWCMQFIPDAWANHPFNPANNVNSVNGDPNGDGKGLEVHELAVKAVTAVQEAYVRKVIDTVNDLGNVLYEISNENHPPSTEWQYHMIRFIKDYEKAKPKQHPVGMTFQYKGGSNKTLFDSPADWVSPNPDGGYRDDPPPADGRKVVLNDTDHLWGIGGNAAWVWKSFLRGHNPLFMDPYDGLILGKRFDPQFDPVRRALGHALRLASRLDLAAMSPQSSLASSKFCLADPGNAYLAYLPDGGKVTVDLSAAKGELAVEWLDPATGQAVANGRVQGGAARELSSPLKGPALVLTARAGAPPKPHQGPSVDISHGDLAVAPNKRFLIHKDGTPFFYLGDTAWELFHRLDRDEAERYLENRRQKGFTVIQAVALAELDGLGVPNAYGHLPLVGNDPTKPAVAGGSDNDYWDHVDWIVARAAEKGIFIGMLPTWGDKWNKKWGKGPEILTPQNAEAYAEWLGRRYRDKPIIWILGGDRPIENDTHRATIRAMAKGLRRGDAGRHLITFHPMGGKSSADWLHDEDWLDFNMLQSGHRAKDLANCQMVAADYARTPTKPCMDGEPRYDDHPVRGSKTPDWFDDYDVRQAAYWNLFAGGHGHTYGCHPIWMMRHPRLKDAHWPGPVRHYWDEVLDLPGAWQMMHARHLMESRPMLDRVPDQTLIAGDAASGADHVQATRGKDYAFVYLPTGKPVRVVMGKISGEKVRAWWFDPRTGEAVPAGEVPNSGTAEFTPLGTPGRGNDWVLVLDDAAKGRPAPGLPGRRE